MGQHAETIDTFYKAFAARDHATMAAAYHDEAHFSDPVFTDLHGRKIGAMWRMLCERGKDLAIEFRDVRAEGDSGSAHWDARYTFSATGRKVLNRIDARFKFKDGKIIEHIDSFDLYAWTKMALGPVGLFLGWSPIVRNKLRRQAAGNLDAFIAKNGL